MSALCKCRRRLKPQNNTLFIPAASISFFDCSIRIIIVLTVIFFEPSFHEIAFIKVAHLHLDLCLNPVFFFGMSSYLSIKYILNFYHPAIHRRHWVDIDSIWRRTDERVCIMLNTPKFA